MKRLDDVHLGHGPRSPRGALRGQPSLDMWRPRHLAQGGAERGTILQEDVDLARSQGWLAEGEGEAE